MKRFWNKVNKTNTCWLWTAAKNNKGYGVFRIKGKNVYSHRLSYLIPNGYLPDDKIIMHACDTPLCVNPAHLIIGTQADNIADMIAKKRGKKSPEKTRGEKNGHSILTEEKVKEIRDTYAEGGVTHKELGIRHGVSSSTIAYTISRRLWKYVNAS